MSTFFSLRTTRFFRGLMRVRTLVFGLVLMSMIAGSLPLSAAHAQPATYSGPTGYSTANAIERGITETAQGASGPLASGINSVFEYVGKFIANILLLFSRLLLRLSSFMIDFIMVIASYNAYIDSTAVNVGWAVARDITNMLFIVVLLVIAFATILGLEGYEWKQLLPKLVMAAVLVNFSRTICGLLIDVSQVIMMTFLNAVSATIGGNIINAFRLPTFEAFHPNVTSAQLTSSGIMSAAALAFAFSALVTAVLGAYVMILGGRLIRLWVLIVLSPFAFLMSILPSTSSFSSSWWGELMDNLVTGPVIMFFVWLSLIVVGTGQVNQEILKGTRLADKTPIEQAFGPAEQTATPTDIGGWNNLANFVIAIGMLLAGAKVASHIGGESGNLLQNAISFGKKVALTGLGYGILQGVFGRASRAPGAAVGLAGKAAGFAYSRTVGRPIDRATKKIGAQVSSYFADQQRKSDEKAAGIDKERLKLQEKGELGRFQSMGMRAKAWYYSSSDRLNKNIKNWEEIAAEKKKQAEEVFGVSGLEAGKILGRERAITEKYVAEGAAGKREKQAKIEQKFAEGVKFIDKQLSPYIDQLATAQRSGNSTQIQNAQSALDNARANLPQMLENEFGRDSAVEPSALLKYHQLTTKQVQSQAMADELEHLSHTAMARTVARERDQLLIAEGKAPVFLRNQLEQENEERRKLLGRLNWHETMGEIKDLAAKIQTNETEFANPATSASRKHHLEEVLRSQYEQMGDFQSANAARGPAWAQEGLKLATESFYGNPAIFDVDAGNVEGQQARELSALLQRRVLPTDVKAAFAELKAKKGEHFGAFMKSYTDSLEAVALQGAVNRSALFKAEWNPTTRDVDYDLIDLTQAPDQDIYNSSRTRALAQSRTMLSKLESFDESLDHVAGQVAVQTNEAADRLIGLLSNQSKHHLINMNNKMKESLRNALASPNTANATKIRIRTEIINNTTGNDNIEQAKALLDDLGI